MSAINQLALRIARPVAFGFGILLSLRGIYYMVATVQIVISQPDLLLPDSSLWTPAQVDAALAGLGLTVGFYVVYSCVAGIMLSLTFMICGWLILLLKSQDWFGMFLALLLLSWGAAIGVVLNVPPPGPVLVTIDNYLGWLMWPGLFMLLYFFPDGHVKPLWARWFALALGLFIVYGLVKTILDVPANNFIFLLPVIMVVLAVGIYAQGYRYRHTQALERQQIKLVVTALVLFAGYFIIFGITQNFTDLGDPSKSGLSIALLYQLITFNIGVIAFAGIPISIALAMLHYRLWDVDVVIRRTLVYGALTGALALVFFGGVTLLQGVFQAVSGRDSAISVVISTLAIAALFNPLRRQVQDFIDRRFYRKKYNAELALKRFTELARSETDIEALSTEIMAVVQETMQPEKAGLWLREAKK